MRLTVLVPLLAALAVASDARAWDGEQTVDGWLMTGIGAPDYTLEADGDAVRIQKSVRQTSRWVAVVRVVPAEAWVGRTFTASLEVRTDGLDEREAGCVMKAQTGRELSYSGFLASNFVTVPTTTKGFTGCELTVQVPPRTKWILYGFTYRGAGKAWVREK